MFTPIAYAHKNYILYGEVGTERIAIPRAKFGDLFRAQSIRGGEIRGSSLVIVATAGKLPSGELYVAGKYTSETVTNVLELVPYLVEVQAPDLFPEGDDTSVYPAAHRHTITSTLLQRFSGTPPTPKKRNLTLVGCGSLGSKIGMHLARSGTVPSVVIDKNSLSPHNAARHALTPYAQDIQLAWLGPKAESLAMAIDGLGNPSKLSMWMLPKQSMMPKSEGSFSQSKPGRFSIPRLP